MANRKYHTQYKAQFLSNTGQWHDVSGREPYTSQNGAFESAHSFLELNEQTQLWPDVTRVRVVSREVSDWEVVAEGRLEDAEE